MVKNTVKIKIPRKKMGNFSYDDWLEFFRKIPASDLLAEQNRLKGEISTEGYAALCRWIEILENPSRMDKLYQGRLKQQVEADIMEVAVGEDDEAFWTALIRENVNQLNSGSSSPQEVARLTQNISIFRTRLHEVRSRKPKKGSTLDDVLKKISATQKEAPKKPSKGKTKPKTIKQSRGK